VTGGGVSVTVQGDAVEEAESALGRLATDGVPASLMTRTANLWGPGATDGAARRLGWAGLPETSRRLLPRLAELTAGYAALDVPGRPYGLEALQLAQASGDLRSLRSRGRPVVRLHLRVRAAGLAQLDTALAG
jgi:glucose-6-phosphate isomerase